MRDIRMRYTVPLCCLLLGALFSSPAFAQIDSVRAEVERLLASDITKDASREQVVEQLVALGEAGAWPMAEALVTKDLFKYLALRAAFLTLDATASPALRHYAEEPPDRRARSALAMLAQIANRADLDFFLEHVDHGKWNKRSQALRGIGRLEIVSTTVEQRIAPALGDPDSAVRRYGAFATGASAASDRLLIPKLNDDDFFVRRAVMRAIAKVWERSATDEIDLAGVIRLTESAGTNPGSLLAIQLLGERGDAAAVDRLKELSKHPDWAVRATAIQALKKRATGWLKQNIVVEEEHDIFVRSKGKQQ